MKQMINLIEGATEAIEVIPAGGNASHKLI